MSTQVQNATFEGQSQSNSALSVSENPALIAVEQARRHGSTAIRPEHRKEWQDSAISDEIIDLNLRTIEDKNAIADFLGWKRYTHLTGWLVKGVDFFSGEYSEIRFGQFKPDKPCVMKDGKTEMKYISPKKDVIPYDAIALAMPDSKYWRKVLDNPSQPIIVTEGIKKAGAGLSAGFPTLSLAGVWNGVLDKKEQLVPALKALATKDRPVTLLFDADVMTKPNVKAALKATGELLEKQGCKVFVCTLAESTKGLDDYLVAYGYDAMDMLLDSAQSFVSWLEAQFPPEKEKPKKVPQSLAASTLAEKYRSSLAWNIDLQSFYRYQSDLGYWKEERLENIDSIVFAELLGLVSEGFSNEYKTGVTKLLKTLLAVESWEEKEGLFPVKNGVLDLESKKLLSHQPGYRLTWTSPISYDPSATCEPIEKWLLEACQGSKSTVQFLRAYMRAVLLNKVELQKFVELVGGGGTGKSTFIKLLTALVGESNVGVTALKSLENNRFELAAIVPMRLITISDSERYGGEVSVLKAITGQDYLRVEKKGIQQTGRGTKAKGLILIAANETIKSNDYTSGLMRRRNVVRFDYQVPQHKRRDLDKEFQPYLSGLLNWVLAMSEEDMKNHLLKTSDYSPEIAQWTREAVCETNPLAEWVDEKVVIDSAALMQIGTLIQDTVNGGLDWSKKEEWAYQNYYLFCKERNMQPVQVGRFSKHLEDLLLVQMKFEGVRKARKDGRTIFRGVRFRGVSDDSIPSPITGLYPDDELEKRFESDLVEQAVEPEKQEELKVAEDDEFGGWLDTFVEESANKGFNRASFEENIEVIETPEEITIKYYISEFNSALCDEKIANLIAELKPHPYAIRNAAWKGMAREPRKMARQVLKSRPDLKGF